MARRRGSIGTSRRVTNQPDEGGISGSLGLHPSSSRTVRTTRGLLQRCWGRGHQSRPLVQTPYPVSAGRYYRGRLQDVLWMTFLKLKAMPATPNDDFAALVEVIIDRI